VEVIELEELRIDACTAQAYLDGVNAQLTRTEFRVLYALATERHRALSRRELIGRLWPRPPLSGERAVDTFVRNLRAKIDRRSPRHTFVQKLPGVGYQLEAQQK
jgi:DNA-binding response OmpR family regulator